MRKINKISGTLLVIGALVLTISVSKVIANVLEFATSNTTATSTISYMTPGTATTTYTYDSYLGGETNATDKLTFLLQFTSSSSPATLRWVTECSMDNIDYYQCELITSTSSAQTLAFPSLPTTYSWLFASSTQAAGGVPTTTTRVLRAFTVIPVTRYSRVSFFLPIGSTNAGVWGTFVGQKQTPQ